MTSEIRGTSKEKFYLKIGFESLQQRLWYRKLFYFHKMFKEQSQNYIFRVISKQGARYAMRSSETFLSIELFMNMSKTIFSHNYERMEYA